MKANGYFSVCFSFCDSEREGWVGGGGWGGRGEERGTPDLALTPNLASTAITNSLHCPPRRESGAGKRRE